ncbi:MAG: thioredoxin family protein [Leptospiraceae bacterium]|nr:thioredoxin family protein [Leptospiraceae bacterium]MDW8305571.1 cytochrome c biogenesis protein CcdA [Leptospiraceae bacterium]
MDFSLIAVAYLHGLLAAFSACVYPLIPITTALFGAGSARLGKGFFLSSLYVLGMAITYVSLGLVAASMGKVFGSWMSHKWVLLAFAVVFVYLAYGFAGLLPLPLPQYSGELGAAHRGSAFYPLLLGIFSGFVAAPCTAPFYGSTLLQIADASARQKSLVPGVLQAFAFALGMGFPFLLVGGLALRLPKPGKWLYMVKYLGACVLVAAAWHYLESAMGFFSDSQKDPKIAITGILLFITAYLLAEPQRDLRDKKTLIRLMSSFWLLVAGFGLFLLTSVVGDSWASPAEKTVQKTEGLTWFADLPTAKKEAQKSESDILIDFWAEWCTACHEMEKYLFRDSEFEKLVRDHRLVLLRLDFTEPDEYLEELAQSYGIRGLPTLILTDKDGRMYHTLIGFYSKKSTLNELRYALKKRKLPLASADNTGGK